MYLKEEGLDLTCKKASYASNGNVYIVCYNLNSKKNVLWVVIMEFSWELDTLKTIFNQDWKYQLYDNDGKELENTEDNIFKKLYIQYGYNSVLKYSYFTINGNNGNFFMILSNESGKF